MHFKSGKHYDRFIAFIGWSILLLSIAWYLPGWIAPRGNAETFDQLISKAPSNGTWWQGFWCGSIVVALPLGAILLAMILSAFGGKRCECGARARGKFCARCGRDIEAQRAPVAPA